LEFTKEGLVLKEIAPGVNLEKDILGKMAFKPLIAPDLKPLAPELFDPKMLHLNSKEPWKGFSLY